MNNPTESLTTLLQKISNKLKGKLGKEDKINAQDFSTAVLDIAFDSISPIMTDTSGDGLNKIEVINIESSTIDQNSFKNLKSLKTINLSSALTSIGKSAFSGCTALSSISIPKSVNNIGTEVFSGCTSLKSIEVDVENVTYDSRDNCDAIIERSSNTLIQGCSETIIPESVTSIGNGAFLNISTLKGEFTIPEGVTSIGGGAFTNVGITKIHIPITLTSIGGYVFRFCYNLKEIVIKDLKKWCAISFSDEFSSPLTYAGGDIYINDSLLKDLEIPENVISIKQYTFYKCHSLQRVSVPSFVESIGQKAFYDCKNIKDLTLNEGLEIILNSAFYNCAINEFIIPNSVVQVGYEAFKNTYWYKEQTDDVITKDGWLLEYKTTPTGAVTITSGIKGLSDRLFYNNKDITSVAIPDGVAYIGAESFRECASITSLAMPNTIQRIGAAAFRQSNISEFDFTRHTSVPTLVDTYAFYGIPNLKIYVKDTETMEKWQKASNWSNFKSNIQVK